jgi:STAS domain
MSDATAPPFEYWDGTPSGGILTTISPGRTVVRLEGEIDLSMSAEFAELLLSLPATTAQLVLDTAGLTFCDSTLAHFVAAMSKEMPVTFAAPNRWILEFLRLVNIDDLVGILDPA